MSILAKRLDAHFVAVAAAAGAGVGIVGTQNADAAIVYSGVVNTNIPANFTGIYLNLETGAVTSGQVGGWDINPYVSGGNWTLFVRSGQTGTVGSVTNVPSGTLIDASNTTGTGGALPLGSGVIVGLKIQNDDASIHYGWARFNFTNGTTPGTLVDYAWENATGTGINAGAVPTPGSLGLLALGAVGLMRRRRA